MARGFNCNEPSEDEPYPDAWCDDCELIRAAHGGWDEESEKLTKITLLCSRCYEIARVRNTRTSSSVDDLVSVRWKCGSCDDWHQGPVFDFGFTSPYYWEPGENNSLDDDYCSIESRDFFVRGIIHLPVIGTAEDFRWGVWGSVSRDNYDKLRQSHGDPARTELPSMFSWLSTQLPGYPDTLNLKMQVFVQAPALRPHFELERTEHPLSQEFYNGITPERLKNLMLTLLGSLT